VIVATVLYEDRRGPTNEFGLHRLVMASVWDSISASRPSVERYRLEQMVNPRPLKGSGNVVRSCRNDVGLITRDGRRLLVVIDDDEVRQLLQLSAKANETQVREKILEGCAAPERVSIHLLLENTETVIDAARKCDGTIPREVVRQALAKSPRDRDVVMNWVARSDRRSIRECVLREVPSLAGLVAELTRVVLERTAD
jgi:hypothetical protein